MWNVHVSLLINNFRMHNKNINWPLPKPSKALMCDEGLGKVWNVESLTYGKRLGGF